MNGYTGTEPGRGSSDGPGPIELWCIDLKTVAAALDAVERRTPRLAASDRQRAQEFTDRTVVAERRATYIALRILIERVLGPDWRGVPLQRGVHGKPQLENAPLAFSYSHAPGVALIGVSLAERRGDVIGVDIERARLVRVRAERRDRIEVAGAALAERAALPGDAEARFLQAWVRLEALAKLRGTGVGRLLSKLGLMGGNGATTAEILSRVEHALSEEPPVAMHDLRLGEELFAAIATPLTARIVQPRWLPESVEAIETLLATGGGGLGVDRAGGAGQKGHGGA